MDDKFTTINLGDEIIKLIPKPASEGGGYDYVIVPNDEAPKTFNNKKNNTTAKPHELHKGHRQRMRSKYKKNGIHSLDPHEALEILLGYSIPRRETNSIAHRLIEEFGSLKNVLNADIEHLSRVEGVGENTAILITLCRDILDYALESAVKNINLTSRDTLDEFCCDLFRYSVNEKLIVIMTDGNRNFLHYEVLAHGNRRSAQVSIKMLIDLITKHNPSCIILAHNHPGNNLSPSSVDVKLTNAILKALAPYKVELIDHLICNGKRALSMEDRGFINRDLLKDEVEIEEIDLGDIFGN